MTFEIRFDPIILICDIYDMFYLQALNLFQVFRLKKLIQETLWKEKKNIIRKGVDLKSFNFNLLTPAFFEKTF